MISVIVNLHNNEKSIIAALQSITAQSAQKWEAVVIDNASSDESEHLVRSYLIDRRMRYVRLDKEVSPEEVRQKGVELTNGEWILFLDATDYLEPNALEALYLVVKKYGTKIGTGTITGSAKHLSTNWSARTLTGTAAIAEGKYSKREDLIPLLVARDIVTQPEAWKELPIAYTEHPVLVNGNGNVNVNCHADGEKEVKVPVNVPVHEKFFSPLAHSGIKVDNLNVHIGDAHILKNVTAEIPKNKITCIIGPSGCGKSTLLRTFNRIIDTTEGVKMQGDIWLGKYNITKVHGAEKIALRRHVGLVPQRPCPLPMSIYDNIAYGCKIHGIRGKERLNRVVEHYLRSIGLWDEVKDRLKQPAARLSGGQQQRLCLARSLAVEPTVLLADESTSALDPISSKKVEQLFVDLKKDYTVVMVTHTLQQAQRVADYVIFMYLGEVIEAGPAKELFNNPQNELTRKYLDGAFS